MDSGSTVCATSTNTRNELASSTRTDASRRRMLYSSMSVTLRREITHRETVGAGRKNGYGPPGTGIPVPGGRLTPGRFRVTGIAWLLLLLQADVRGVPQRAGQAGVLLEPGVVAVVRQERRLLVERDGVQVVPQELVDLVAQVLRRLVVSRSVDLREQLVDPRVATARVVLGDSVTLRALVERLVAGDEGRAHPGEQGDLELATLEAARLLLAREDVGVEELLDLDAHRLQLLGDHVDRVRPQRVALGGHDLEGQPLAVLRVDAVGTLLVAVALEQRLRLGDVLLVVEAAAVVLVARLVVDEVAVVEHLRPAVELGDGFGDDVRPVQRVRERLPHRLVGQLLVQGVEVEVLEGQAEVGAAGDRRLQRL